MPEVTAPLDPDLAPLKALLDSLSPREGEVLFGLALGESNKTIAQHYGISQKTVDTHRSHMLKKLRCRNNADAARFALRTGVITYATQWPPQ